MDDVVLYVVTLMKILVFFITGRGIERNHRDSKRYGTAMGPFIRHDNY